MESFGSSGSRKSAAVSVRDRLREAPSARRESPPRVRHVAARQPKIRRSKPEKSSKTSPRVGDVRRRTAALIADGLRSAKRQRTDAGDGDGTDPGSSDEDGGDAWGGAAVAVAEPADPDDVAAEIERELHAADSTGGARYRARARLIVASLRSDGAGSLRDRLLRGGMTAREAVTLPPAELGTDETRAREERVRADNLRSRLADDGGPGEVTTTSPCERCGAADATRRVVRSANTSSKSDTWGRKDEPESTAALTCRQCGNRWTESE